LPHGGFERGSLENLVVFASLFILGCLAIGILLAILLDQRIRIEGALRTIYLYPMALSFIVTGTAWKWILNPGLGIERVAHDLGFESFTFDWLVNREMAIYTVVIAGVWQSSGYVMALFLAGLRSIDDEILKAAAVDGAGPWRTNGTIVLPMLRPVFLSAIIVLAHLAIKSFDLVVALTAGGPGIATDLPATFMYAYAFQRSELGLAAASAVMMLVTILAVVVPTSTPSSGRAGGERAPGPRHRPAEDRGQHRAALAALRHPRALRALLPDAADRHGDDGAEAARRDPDRLADQSAAQPDP
jgi:glucose/mannose transport system permease protein